MMFLLIVLIAINLVISWWNARVIGLMWVEARTMGGFVRFMTWMGWIMSASGFTWCYLIILVFGAHELGYVDKEAAKATLSLGYLLIIPGVIFSGFFIWIESVVEAWRRRDAAGIGTAVWNTFAQAHNTYSAIEGTGEAWKSVAEFFSGGNDEDGAKAKAGLLVIMLVVLSIAAGIITTEVIRRNYAGRVPMPSRTAYAR